MTLPVLACLLGLVFSWRGLPSTPQAAPPPDKVDEYIESQMRARRIPGLALLVVRDGRIVKAKGYGFANVEHRVPVKPETVFQSGSMGKQFTAAAVMMLAEEHTEDQLLKKAMAIPLAFRPGEKWQYSNMGYVTLGIVIGQVTGKFYGDDVGKLLAARSLQAMWTPVTLNDGKPNAAGYGFGWRVGEVRGHRVIEHAGAWQGFTSNISRYVDDRLTVAALANLAGVPCDRISHEVAGLYDESLQPPRERPIPDKEPRIAAMLTALLQAVAAGTADKTLFTPDLQRELFPDAIREFAGELAAWGRQTSIALLHRGDEDGIRLYRYRVVFEKESLVIELRLNAADKIAGMRVLR